MSTHKVPVIEIGPVVPHPDADALEITHVGGWQCVVPIGGFKEGDRAIYIEPDYVVDTTRPEFSFLDKKGRGKPHRLRAVKLRGALSYGLLIPVPAFLSHVDVGDDVMGDLGVVRYEPPEKNYRVTSSEAVSGPPEMVIPVFDLENIQNYADTFRDGETVYVTEKLHGTNARFMCWNDVIYCGSRRQWVADKPYSLWWKTFRQYPGIEKYLRANPGHIVYGEIYGDVQEMKYGHAKGETSFAAFAILDVVRGEYIPNDELRIRLERPSVDVPCVPLLWRGPWNAEAISTYEEIAEENTMTMRGDGVPHLSEGVVISPQIERLRWDIGRVVFKYISKRYWFKK